MKHPAGYEFRRRPIFAAGCHHRRQGCIVEACLIAGSGVEPPGYPAKWFCGCTTAQPVSGAQGPNRTDDLTLTRGLLCLAELLGQISQEGRHRSMSPFVFVRQAPRIGRTSSGIFEGWCLVPKGRVELPENRLLRLARLPISPPGLCSNSAVPDRGGRSGDRSVRPLHQHPGRGAAHSARRSRG